MIKGETLEAMILQSQNYIVAKSNGIFTIQDKADKNISTVNVEDTKMRRDA